MLTCAAEAVYSAWISETALDISSMLTASILAELRDAVGVDGLIIDRNQLQTLRV